MALQVDRGPRRSIGKYEVLGRLGAGGMAEVFLCRARDEKAVERLVAVKRTLPGLTTDEKFLSMFIDEARISANLAHDNIAQVVEFGRHGNQYFIAMEYVEGVDLRAIRRFFRALGQLPPWAMAAHIAGKICAALDYAHSKRDHHGEAMNIIHRDVSPANVLISFEGQIKLIDFGIARAAERLFQTMGSVVKGKIAYMSPEQSIGDPVDHRTDIFGAGIVLYELLTGKNPFVFPGEGDRRCLARVREANIAPPSTLVPDLPSKLEQVCMRAVQRRAADRFGSAGEMQEELEAFCHKIGYGYRKFNLWLKEAFADQIHATREALREVWELAKQPTAVASASALQSAPTLMKGGLEQVPTVIAPEVDEQATVAAKAAARRRDDPADRAIADTVAVDGGLAAVETVIDRGAATARSAPLAPVATVPDEIDPAADAARPEGDAQHVPAPAVVPRPPPPRSAAMWIIAAIAGVVVVAALIVVLVLLRSAEPEPRIAAPAADSRPAKKTGAPAKKAGAPAKKAGAPAKKAGAPEKAGVPAVEKTEPAKTEPTQPVHPVEPRARPVRRRPTPKRKKRASEDVNW